jgi:hypothetical protein
MNPFLHKLYLVVAHQESNTKQVLVAVIHMQNHVALDWCEANLTTLDWQDNTVLQFVPAGSQAGQAWRVRSIPTWTNSFYVPMEDQPDYHQNPRYFGHDSGLELQDPVDWPRKRI